MSPTTTLLYRPIGAKELELIAQSGYRAFPPRLPEQPFFYPVLQEAYAIQIARDWNVPAEGIAFVTRFAIKTAFLKRYPVRQVGNATHRELWVPAEELPLFNQNIVGLIEIIAQF